MKFVMSRDRVVVSRLGRSFEFKKGEPLHVPSMCWDEVQAQGAVPEEELPEPEAKIPTVPEGVERAAKIAEAIKVMVLRGQREDFTASGAPHAAVLSNEVGFIVDAKERDLAWAAAQNDAS